MKLKNIDVGIIVFIREELKQLLETFKVKENNKVDSIDNRFTYYLFSLPTKKRNISIVISFINGKSGNIESALCTSYFFKNWNPKFMCLLGIAAGIENKVKIGDVVIPYKVHDITIKSYSKSEFNNRANTYTLSDEINEMIKTAPNDHTFNFSVKDGSLGTDNILIKDSLYFDKYLYPIDEECRGCEMESAGFIRTCKIEETPWLVLRGISDFGKDKVDDSQTIAAKNACLTLKYFLENCLDLDKITLNKRKVANYYMEDYFEHILYNNYSKQNWLNVCEINNIMSRYLLISGQYEARIKFGEKALRAAKNGNFLKYSCRILIDDLGWTNYLLFLETSSTYYKELAIKNINNGLYDAEKINDYYVLSKGNRHLASINRQAEELSTSNKNLKKAEAYMKLISDIDNKNELESALLLSKSKLYYARFKKENKKTFFEKCIEYAHQAEQEYQNLADNERIVKVYKFLSKVFQDKEETEVANTYQNKMNELMKQYGRVLYWD